MMFSFNENLLLLISFLIGSIPFGLIIVKLHGLGNISKQGSGNIGATNVARVAGKKLAVFTFVLDFLKGFLLVLVFLNVVRPEISVNYRILVFLLPVLGHMFSPWVKFKGGKGVATGLGVIFAIDYVIGFMCLLCWFVTFRITRISSASALVCYGLMPIFFVVMHPNQPHLAIFAVILSLLVFVKHYQNIIRLINGSESGFKKK